MARENDLGLELGSAGQGLVEVVHLKPQEDAVAIGMNIRIADRQMVVGDLETVQLENEDAARDQPLVLRPSVPALTAQEMPVPATAGLHIGNRYEGLRTHRNLLSMPARRRS